jgi:hypothetical protein
MKPIGKNFSTELSDAGLLGLPFSWGEDGTFNFSDEITELQKTAILDAYKNHQPDNIEIPVSVTMRKARLALLEAGKLHMVAPAIESLPSPQKEAAQIEWEYSQDVERASPLVAMMAQALDLDDAALDALFLRASEL